MAARYIPMEQLALSPQCGFASSGRGNPLTEEQQWHKLELGAAVSQKIWKRGIDPSCSVSTFAAKARFVQSVMRGKNGRMPPWGDLLSPGDVDKLWAYVKAGGK